MAQKVQLKRSSVVTNGAPKLPTTSQVEVGELTINFAEGYETLSTKNSNNNIATFSSDAVLDRKYISSGAVVSAVSAVSKTIEDNEYVIAQTFNDQHERLLALENAGFLTAFTETDPTVPAWAKASTKPTYTASEVGALPTGTTLDGIADGTTRKLSNYSLTSHTHSEYSLTGHSHTAAEVGALPDTTEIPTQASILSSGFTKNAITGVTINGTPASVSNGVATANVTGLPSVTSSDNGKVLMVSNGQWAPVMPVTVYSGNMAPDNVLGNNGDIYLQTS